MTVKSDPVPPSDPRSSILCSCASILGIYLLLLLARTSVSKLPLFGLRLPSHSVIHWRSSLSAGVLGYMHSGLAIVSATVHILRVTGVMNNISVDIVKVLCWNFYFHRSNCVLKLIMVLEVLPLV